MPDIKRQVNRSVKHDLLKEFPMRYLVIVFLIVFNFKTFAQQTLHFQSGEEQVQLLELYSSQGCSSCPPAEIWLSRLKHSPVLWDKVVPAVFHVDYWNDLGWRDPFSSADYSKRQRTFAEQGLSSAVYTPGFFINGREWRGWFNGKSLPIDEQPAGILSVTFENNDVSVSYSQADTNQDVHIALLGLNASTKVDAGENHGRSLVEDFVVLKHVKYLLSSQGETSGHWQLPPIPQQVGSLAIAVWVTSANSLLPLQATGGQIPDGYFNG
ncbi:DUF1223 domain-containing protein [Neptunicella marina]|uniref:DUF1223 domain-containing protein n=1 Tax=Neptunicella marina TaxID=2125989 RepID=A0A8J6M2G6_9ALTE|nr:DUF1223 domain-containing protein [Neptunicella marina]MBC3766192.1 DUF1223 domain-containing protein [Neptunicella marina]